MPITQKKSSSHPKEFFLYLTTIIALYVCTAQIIVLLFEYINVLFPDQLSFYLPSALENIRTSTAILIILFPAFLFTSGMIRKGIKSDNKLADISVRKWLLSLTLSLAAAMIVIDLIRLVYHFLSGELTGRFLLKIAVVLIVALPLFWYYLWELRDGDDKKSKKPKQMAVVSSVVVLATIIAGFFLVGSPWHQRNIRLDQERVDDLQSIQWQIVHYWNQKNVIPESIEELDDEISGFLLPLDPDTGAHYEYEKTGRLTFNLCATFAAEAAGDRFIQPRRPVKYPFDRTEENWQHAAGRVCFERTIDPELHKED